VSVDTLLSRLNPWIAVLLRSPLHPLLSPGLLLLTVTGRRSGRRYTIPVGYQRDGDDVVVLVSEARRKQWWRNYREPGAVSVRLRGADRTGRAELVSPDSPEFRDIADRTLRRVPTMRRVFRVGNYDPGLGLDTDQLAKLGAEIAIVRIRLDPPRVSARERRIRAAT
jgi:deazaflavin-dependent oxidoreductase (nitroreductase family)